MSELVKIPLLYKSTREYFALVDERDFDFLDQYKPWHLSIGANTFYAYSLNIVPGKAILMHRLLMNLADSKIKIEHLDGNGLHNSRSNIQVKVKRANSSDRRSKKRFAQKIKDGIYYCNFYCQYKATLLYRNKTINVGYFDTREQAIKARKERLAKLTKIAQKESLSLEDILNPDSDGPNKVNKDKNKSELKLEDLES